MSPYRTLIQPEALARLLDTAPDQTVVLDCSFDLTDPAAGRRAFEAAHLPGAQYLHLDEDLSSAKTGRNGRHPLPDRVAFARRLGLPAGAGSDEHVLAGLFTAGLELPAFHDPASLALALGDARVVRNEKSFLALQARKWFRTRRRPPRAE